MSLARRVEALWARNGMGARALAPLAWAYGLVTAARNRAYDAGLLRTHDLGMPAVSVGNLSVGGTGKTPVASWVAQRLLARGARPAILLRGYGGDEPLVHARLTPAAMVIADPDRVRGAAEARRRGADVAVLDDAFQHRRARRDADLVLVAAEQGAASRLLPAGPLREGWDALRRGHAVLVTRKTETRAAAEAVLGRLAAAAPGLAPVLVSLAPGGLELAAGVAGDPTRPLEALRDRRVLAVSAIGAPRAFESQLAALGAQVTSAAYPDHHAFTDGEVAELARRGADTDFVVCTLKDAVKLAPRWPRHGGGLWYLSQAVTVERGAEALDALLDRLVAARRS